VHDDGNCLGVCSTAALREVESQLGLAFAIFRARTPIIAAFVLALVEPQGVLRVQLSLQAART
jgi:hypothetical protein